MQKTTTDPNEPTVELLEEQAHVTTRTVGRGRVVVKTSAEIRQKLVEARLRQEEVGGQLVPIGQVVETMPQIREEDGGRIVWVVEERLVVRTEPVLKEELRIAKPIGEQLVRRTVPFRCSGHQPDGGGGQRFLGQPGRAFRAR